MHALREWSDVTGVIARRLWGSKCDVTREGVCGKRRGIPAAQNEKGGEAHA
jgi:hypothetical protein